MDNHLWFDIRYVLDLGNYPSDVLIALPIEVVDIPKDELEVTFKYIAKGVQG